jgi:anti-sigma-K factor RskA
MSRCDDIELLLPGHAMGVLPDDEEAAVLAHLAECAACSADLTRVSATVGALEPLLPAVEPPPALRGRVLDAVAAAAGESGTRTAAEPSPQQPGVDPHRVPTDDVPSLGAARAARARRRRWLEPSVAWPSIAAAVACIALLAVSFGMLSRIGELEDSLDETRSELRAARGDDDARSTPVAGTYTAEQRLSLSRTRGFAATDASVAMTPGSDAAVLVIRDLPAPSEGHSWQAWSIDAAGRKRSLDVLDRASGLVVIGVDLRAGDDPVQAVAITLEPRGGSKQPTGVPVAHAQMA